MSKDNNFINLGPTDIQVSRMGIGIWAWGARFFWGYGKNYQEKDLRDAFSLITSDGINFFDTAEVYGSGMSEKILGKFITGLQEKLVIATKFFPFPWRIDPRSGRRAIRNSLRRLILPKVDLYQLHMPFPPYPNQYWLRKLAPLVRDGYTKAIGVSNFNLKQTKHAKMVLEDHGVPLVSNQVRFSLLDRDIERTGLLDFCKENRISVIAYSPLAMGMLTGKYSANNPPRGIRQSAYHYTPAFLRQVQPILNLMHEIGQGHGEITTSQVAINWAMAKGTIPIPGVKNVRQATDNANAIKWQLTPGEVDALDNITEKILRN
jgi:aryl-alcohol dehydrogenase-like predicted oxidoreductase